jgi:uncharacterized protein YcfJ
MKLQPWITTISKFGLLSMILVVSAANAGGHGHKKGNGRAVYDYANVVSVQAIVRYVTVKTPVKECWNEEQTYTNRTRAPGTLGRTVFGAIVGGVVGHQFGSGSGNDVATVAGSLLGAAIGNGSARKASEYHTTRYTRPVRRCTTNYQSHEEERVDGYKVVYAYNGRKYSTRTPFDPGNRLRIRVDVRPAP